MSAFLFNLVPVPELDLNGGTWREACIRKSYHDAMSVVGGKRKQSARQKQVGLTPHAVQVDVPAQYPVLMVLNYVTPGVCVCQTVMAAHPQPLLWRKGTFGQLVEGMTRD